MGLGVVKLRLAVTLWPLVNAQAIHPTDRSDAALPDALAFGGCARLSTHGIVLRWSVLFALSFVWLRPIELGRLMMNRV